MQLPRPHLLPLHLPHLLRPPQALRHCLPFGLVWQEAPPLRRGLSCASLRPVRPLLISLSVQFNSFKLGKFGEAVERRTGVIDKRVDKSRIRSTYLQDHPRRHPPRDQHLRPLHRRPHRLALERPQSLRTYSQCDR